MNTKILSNTLLPFLGLLLATALASSFPFVATAASGSYASQSDMDKWFNASRDGKAQIISQMLLDGFPINLETSEGETALHWAIVNGHEDVIDVLLMYSTLDLNVATRNSGFSPLMLASATNKTELVKKLIARGARLDQADLHGSTSLIHAARRAHLETTKVLVDSGADPFMTDTSNKDAATWASDQGYEDVATVIRQEIYFIRNPDLILRNLKLEKTNDTLLAETKSNHVKNVRYLVKAGVDLNATDFEGLSATDYAMYLKLPAMTQVLQKLGGATHAAKLAQKQLGPRWGVLPAKRQAEFNSAIQRFEDEAVDSFLAAGIPLLKTDIDKAWGSPGALNPLTIAVDSDNAYAVSALLSQGADTQWDDPLCRAEKRNNKDVMNAIREHKSLNGSAWDFGTYCQPKTDKDAWKEIEDLIKKARQKSIIDFPIVYPKVKPPIWPPTLDPAVDPVYDPEFNPNWNDTPGMGPSILKPKKREKPIWMPDISLPKKEVSSWIKNEVIFK